MHSCTICEINVLVGVLWKSIEVLEKSLKNGCNCLYEPWTGILHITLRDLKGPLCSKGTSTTRGSISLWPLNIRRFKVESVLKCRIFVCKRILGGALSATLTLLTELVLSGMKGMAFKDLFQVWKPSKIVNSYWTKLSKYRVLANNWSARHWQNTIFFDNRVH